MPTYIVKLKKADKDFYLLWSTVVDAPVSMGESLDAFKKTYQHKYGEDGMRDLPERLERVEKTGCSSHRHCSAEELLMFNRAGDGEKDLTLDEIIESYCHA